MKKSNNSAFYGGLAVIVVIASFLYSWKFIIPKYTENKAESASLDTQISSSTRKLDSLKKSQSTITQLGEIPKQLSVAVPEDKDMPNLITELEALANKYQIVIPSISVSDGSTSAQPSGVGASSGSSANGVNISFAVPGSFEAISGLISALEKDVRFMNIKSVSIASAGDEESSSKMSVSLTIEAYKRGSKASPAASSAAAGGAASPLNETE